jgi:hypothetical protein
MNIDDLHNNLQSSCEGGDIENFKFLFLLFPEESMSIICEDDSIINIILRNNRIDFLKQIPINEYIDNTTGANLIFLALQFNCSLNIFKILIENNINCKWKDYEGNGWAHYCWKNEDIFDGNLDIIKLLLQQYPDGVNILNKSAHSFIQYSGVLYQNDINITIEMLKYTLNDIIIFDDIIFSYNFSEYKITELLFYKYMSVYGNTYNNNNYKLFNQLILKFSKFINFGLGFNMKIRYIKKCMELYKKYNFHNTKQYTTSIFHILAKVIYTTSYNEKILIKLFKDTGLKYNHTMDECNSTPLDYCFAHSSKFQVLKYFINYCIYADIKMVNFYYNTPKDFYIEPWSAYILGKKKQDIENISKKFNKLILDTYLINFVYGIHTKNIHTSIYNFLRHKDLFDIQLIPLIYSYIGSNQINVNLKKKQHKKQHKK